MAEITVFGADWCADTRHTRQHLADLGLDYRYVNIEEDPEAEDWVREQNDGAEKLPTLNVGGLVLSIPSDAELDVALRRQGFVPRDV
ncbi:MAG: NrdH-redoxin [Phycisphaerales bacterium]|nr:NrdH-redoxin [Phycisphaerales bacterium]MDB5298755.1 NrdH-redoxin [Phycisphaerales bacterium]